jgi:predicted glutamine amidotransferase
LFRAVTPAWNNANLVSLARVVKSSCILAHVRAATQIRAVSAVNCHPFVAGRFAFMHNGDLGGFPYLRRRLLERLSDENFELIQGQTDSEHLFSLFLEHAGGANAELAVDALGKTVVETIRDALELARDHGRGHHSYLNLAVTNGEVGVITRFTTDNSYPGETLYINIGHRYVCEENVCHMIAPEIGGAAVIVSSERLSPDPGWEPVPANHMVLIGADRSTRTVPINC